MNKKEKIPWPVGILLAPFMVVFVLLMAVFMSFMILGAALLGQLTWEYTGRK